jgi:selenocysteine-specific elongation factor
MIVATAGHIDHGKSRLVQALTGVDPDRLPEEKARGMTIDLGFAYRTLLSGRRLGFVDVPGHEKFIRNMLAGVTGIDFALLVVAADDGPMPQTREHLAILDLIGVGRGAVALSKTDRVEAARIAEVAAEVTALLAPTTLGRAPIFPVSSATGQGIEALLAHLEASAAEVGGRAAGGNFRLAVDRCFSVAGAGLVVTGTVFSGRVRLGDQLVLSPRGLPVRVRGIHAQNVVAETGTAGERVALNLVGADLDKSMVRRGDWILAAPAHAPTRKLDAEVRVLAGEARALAHWTPVHVHLGAADVSGRIALLEGRGFAPGASGLAQLVLDHEIGAVAGDRLVLRDQGAARTLAGGRVLDTQPPLRGRARPERLAQLRILGHADAATALAALLDQAPNGIALPPFRRARNLTPDEADAIEGKLAMTLVGAGEAALGLAERHWQALLHVVLDALRGWHERQPESLGPGPLELRRALSRSVPLTLFHAALDALIAERRMHRRGGFLHLPSHQARPSPREAELWRRLRPVLEAHGLRPPRTREIADELKLDLKALETFLNRAQQLGLALKVTGNRSFLPETLRRLAEIAEALAKEAADEPFEARAFRDRSEIGRNLTIEVLEYFDRVGFTRRAQEGRRLLRPAAEAFPLSEE